MAPRGSLPARLGYTCRSTEKSFAEYPADVRETLSSPRGNARCMRMGSGTARLQQDRSGKIGMFLFPEGQCSTEVSVYLGCSGPQQFRQGQPLPLRKKYRGPGTLRNHLPHCRQRPETLICEAYVPVFSSDGGRRHRGGKDKEKIKSWCEL